MMNLESEIKKAEKDNDKRAEENVLSSLEHLLQYVNELQAKGLAEGRAEGESSGMVKELVSLVYDGDLDIETAANRALKRCGVEKDAFRKMVESYNPDDNLMEG